MGPGTHVVGSDVPLQVAWVSENLVTVLTGKPPELPMFHFVSQQIGTPSKASGTVLTGVLAS